MNKNTVCKSYNREPLLITAVNLADALWLIRLDGWESTAQKLSKPKKITLTSLSIFIEVRLSCYRIYRDQSRKDFVQKQYFLQLCNSIFNEWKIEGKPCYAFEIILKITIIFTSSLMFQQKLLSNTFGLGKKVTREKNSLPYHIYQEQFWFCLKKNLRYDINSKKGLLKYLSNKQASLTCLS